MSKEDLIEQPRAMVRLDDVERIINAMATDPDAVDMYGAWDEGFFLATPCDVIRYLKHKLTQEGMI